MKSFKFLVIIFFIFSNINLFAQDPTIDHLFAISFTDLLNVEITTATGTAKTLKKAPAVATIITEEDIERMGATTLSEALESVPGLHSFPSSLGNFSPIWSIRGIYSIANSQVLLLINGISIKDLFPGSRGTLFRISTSMIKKIEVILGPGSSVQGADAFAGVVNVITKDADDIDGTNSGFRYGSFDTHDMWFQHGGNYKGWDIALGIENQKTDGDEDRIIQQDFLGSGPPSLTPTSPDTSYEIIDTHLSVKKDNFKLNFFYSWQESAKGPGGIQVITFGNKHKIRFFNSDITYQNSDLFADWDISFKLYGSRRKVEEFYQFFPLNFLTMYGNPIWKNNDSGLEVSGIYSGFNNHNIRVGAGMQYFDIETDQYKNFGPGITNQFGPMVRMKDTPFIFLKDHYRWQWNVFAQDEWEISDKLELTAGVRYDDYNDFGSTTNPRLALVWNTSDTLNTKLLYGQAFRAPSFGEQHLINNPVALGNPDIGPEEIETLELVINYQPFSDLNFAFNLFTYEIEGLIEYVHDPLPATTSSAQNYQDQEGYGYEIELLWDILDNLRLQSNFSWQKSENKRTNETIPDAPGHQFYTDLTWCFLPNWYLSTQYNFIADRERATSDTREAIDDYDLVNVNLRYKHQTVTFACGVKNLFDEDAREPSDGRIPNDYPLETRSYFGEARYSF